MNAIKKYKAEKWKQSISLPLKILRKSPVIIIVLGVFLAVCLSACSTVDQRPFVKFNTVANEITAIDTAVDSHISIVKEREMEQISNDLNAINNLGLEFDENKPFEYRYKYTIAAKDKEPLFIKLRRFDSGLTELNASFIEYTRLLVKLADSELIETEDFDQLATDLNNNLSSALKSFGKEQDASRLAMFSTIASTAAHAYISNKRKEHLIDILNANQGSVDGFIEHAQEAILVLRDGLIDEYDSSRRALGKQYNTSNDKRLIANKVLANSEETAATLEMFDALNKTYRSLAETHKKLAIGLKNGLPPSFSDLSAHIRDVQKRYANLKKANEETDKIDKKL